MIGVVSGEKVAGPAEAERGVWANTRNLFQNISSPRGSLFGQGFRFALAGSLSALVYLTTTTLLYSVFDLRFQVALAAGYVLAVAVHFNLQRLFVWRHQEEFALSYGRQMIRYLPVSLSQYGITILATSQLPSLMHVPVEIVYLVTALTLTVINFIVFRGLVFHADSAEMCAVERPLTGEVEQDVPKMR